MKYPILILIITGILLQNFNRIFICIDFELKQEYIARHLCVKRDLPNNTCKGRCHLKKQLATAEEQERQKEAETEKSGIDLFIPYFPSVLSWLSLYPLTVIKEYCSYNTGKYYFLSPKGIFRPPRQI